MLIKFRQSPAPVCSGVLGFQINGSRPASVTDVISLEVSCILDLWVRVWDDTAASLAGDRTSFSSATPLFATTDCSDIVVGDRHQRTLFTQNPASIFLYSCPLHASLGKMILNKPHVHKCIVPRVRRINARSQFYLDMLR